MKNVVVVFKIFDLHDDMERDIGMLLQDLQHLREIFSCTPKFASRRTNGELDMVMVRNRFTSSMKTTYLSWGPNSFWTGSERVQIVIQNIRKLRDMTWLRVWMQRQITSQNQRRAFAG